MYQVLLFSSPHLLKYLAVIKLQRITERVIILKVTVYYLNYCLLVTLNLED